MIIKNSQSCDSVKKRHDESTNRRDGATVQRTGYGPTPSPNRSPIDGFPYKPGQPHKTNVRNKKTITREYTHTQINHQINDIKA